MNTPDWISNYRRAEELAATGQQVEALELLKSVAADPEQDKEKDIACGHLFLRLGVYDRAISHFSKVPLEQIDSPYALESYLRAIWVRDQRDVQSTDAITAAEKLLLTRPSSRDVRKLCTWVFINKRRYLEALMVAPVPELANGSSLSNKVSLEGTLALKLAKGENMVNVDYRGSKLTFDLNHSTTQSIESSLAHVAGVLTESEELEYLEQFVSQNCTIVEVGVLLGNHSAFFLHRLNPKRLTLIEGDPLMLGSIEIMSAANNQTGCDVEIKHAFVTSEPGYTDFGDDKVENKRLDDLVDASFDFIKIDVDGGETDLLSSSADLFKRVKPKIMLEVQPDTETACLALLESWNFKVLHRVNHQNYANLFLVPES